MSVALVLVYNAGLIFGDPANFLQGHQIAVIPWQVWSDLFFSSQTHGTIFNRIRQVALTGQNETEENSTSLSLLFLYGHGTEE